MISTPPQDSLEHRIAVGLSKIGLVLKSQSWQDTGRQGLTPTQGQILSILRAKGASGMRLSRVAEELEVTAATASDAVKSLVEKELVHKTKAPDDGRAIAILMTSKGKQVAEQVADWPDFLMDGINDLSELEQEVFLRGLIKIIRKFQEKGQVSVAQMCVNCQFFQPNAYPESDQPHHCAFVDAAFGDRNLQIDCPDHVAAKS
ncbi:MAG: MarR family winged helix-turn-helix transcriptional regulator [Microcoleaceae cyanobacterium]